MTNCKGRAQTILFLCACVRVYVLDRARPDFTMTPFFLLCFPIYNAVVRVDGYAEWSMMCLVFSLVAWNHSFRACDVIEVQFTPQFVGPI